MERMIKKDRLTTKPIAYLFNLTTLSILSFIVLWYLISIFFATDFLPSPIAVLNSLFKMLTSPVAGATLQAHALDSFIRFIIGATVSMGLAIPLGLVSGYYNVVNRIIDPIYEILRYIPPIAWIPFAIFWFGLGIQSQAFIIAVGVFMPSFMNARRAVDLVDKILLDAAKTLGAKDKDLFFSVVLPASVPTIVAGIRTAVGLGWMCLVAAEMISRPALRGSTGLGYLIQISRMTGSIDRIIGGMVVIGLLGAAFDYSFRFLERRLQHWKGI